MYLDAWGGGVDAVTLVATHSQVKRLAHVGLRANPSLPFTATLGLYTILPSPKWYGVWRTKGTPGGVVYCARVVQ